MKNDTLIIDGDYPMTYGALDLNRELTRPIDEVRKAQPIDGHDESSILSLGGSDAGTMASLPEMRRAGIAAALVKICRRIYRQGSPMPGFRSGEQAYAAAQADLAYYRILESLGHARILQTGDDLRNHMLDWSNARERSELPVGMFLGLEGVIRSSGPNKYIHGGRPEYESLACRTMASAPTATGPARELQAGCSHQLRSCLVKWNR